MKSSPIRQEAMQLHGHSVSYRIGGEGPAILLIHGVTGSSGQWEPAMQLLADHYTVIAPDLLGHGLSAKPRGDYSLGAYASGVRDLTVALGITSATVVGHSLGGGIALQFAYQFPERVDRLALVSSGRARSGRAPAAAGGHAARLRVRAAADLERAGAGRRRRRVGFPRQVRPARRRRTSRSSPAATPRSRTATRGGPFSTRCAP